MQIDRAEYNLARLAACSRPAQVAIGEVEASLLRSRTASIHIEAPIFVTGLARSGTTIVLTQLNKARGVDGHHYCDYPLVCCPVLWGALRNAFSTGSAPPASERAHQDGIWIDQDSPDAFEEPVWRLFFDFGPRDGVYAQLLGERDWNPAFNRFFEAHLRKIIYLRRCRRYLSKGNYNALRLPYLCKLFPDAKFVIPVRNPRDHIRSLVQQHRLFCDYAKADTRVPRYMAMLGHYEFGPQRCVPGISAECTELCKAYWAEGKEFAGYALIWATLYRWLHDFAASDQSLSARIRFVHHERLCKEPVATLRELADFLDVSFDSAFFDQAEREIRPSRGAACVFPPDERALVDATLRDAAELFEYEV